MRPASQRRRVEGPNLATPNYLRTGLLLAEASSMEGPGDTTDDTDAPRAKWIPDRSVLSQQQLDDILQRGSLPFKVCVDCIESQAAAALRARVEVPDDHEVELFPRRLSVAVTKDGRILTMSEAGVRPSNEPAVLNVSTQQSVTLFGRERRIADVPLDHLSCSSQHAVIANVLGTTTDMGDVTAGTQAAISDVADLFDVTTALRDVGSTHGTRLNGQRVPANVWCPLAEGDRIVFGMSSRVYVVMRQPTASSR